MSKEVDFDLSKDVEIDVDASLEVDVDVDVEKDVEVDVCIEIEADVEGNTAELYLSNEAFGDDTYAEADIVMWTTDYSSSIEVYAISVTD
jgi:hypothetical protein